MRNKKEKVEREFLYSKAREAVRNKMVRKFVLTYFDYCQSMYNYSSS